MSAKYKPRYSRMAQLKSAADLQNYLQINGIGLPFDETLLPPANSPFGRPIQLKSGKTIGNSLCILPMEGWDGTTDGRPTDFTRNRWAKFAVSGAKLLFGCEAVAVCHAGKANPNQLVLNADTFPDFVELRQQLLRQHEEKFGRTNDLLIGLQLTHSGRFCKPDSHKTFAPKILYAHPYLNARFGVAADYPTLTDEAIDQIIEHYVEAAVLAQQAGFDFVDIKHCHGYLGHEFLSARSRPGNYGGSFANRTRFLREIVAGIRRDAPGLLIGVRLSAFDFIPYRKGAEQRGEPETFAGAYDFAFGANPANPLEIDLTEAAQFLSLLEELNIKLVCITAGSPYYIPHIQRPALFPPSDGYLPPEDPLIGVARLLQATSELKQKFPNLALVGTGYSYLQEWLPHVGQHFVRTGQVDFVGLGRLVLSYHDLPADVLQGHALQTKRLCRTFSDCTTGPRNGLVSGCFPLDPVYKAHPHAAQLKAFKQASKSN